MNKHMLPTDEQIQRMFDQAMMTPRGSAERRRVFDVLSPMISTHEKSLALFAMADALFHREQRKED